MKKAALLALTLLTVLLCPRTPAPAAQSGNTNLESQIKKQEKERESLNQKIKQYNELARQKERESQTLLGQLDRLRQDASESQSRMKHLEKENGRLQSSMDALTQDIANTRKTLDGLLPRLRVRVLDMYKYGTREGLDVILSIGNAHDALTTAYMLGCFLRHDQDIVRELADHADTLSRSRARLEEERAQVRIQAEELERKRSEFDTTIRQTNALLKDIQGQQRKARSAAQELSGAQREIGNRINSLMRQKKAREDRASKAPQPKTPEQGKQQQQQQQSQKPAPKSYAYLPKGAALEWPLRGTVTAPFGSRVHPVFKTKVFNSGIDIQAASGAPVRSAGPGEVLYSGWMRGFGQVVIVDHGGSISTVYAHLASAAVREGDAVRTGSILGTVGNSGADTDYGLHFEVRKDGAAQNPMNYLRK